MKDEAVALKLTKAVLGAFLVAGWSGNALAADQPSEDKLQVQPLLDLRLRYENVDQPTLDANGLTLRLRAGAEAKLGHFSFLAEVEGTAALVNNYNAFPFPLPGEDQWRPQYSVIADPENAELNRLQLQYKTGSNSVTLGRQRINLDDQRWVGSVGWRQNEQTFDAVRGEAKLGPVAADLTYAIKQRTIFGADAGPRTAFDGHFIFAGLSSKVGPIQGKLFAYLLDYDEDFFLANSSQSYGLTLSTAVPITGKTKLSLRASYARQSDYAQNPFDYATDYWSLEAGTALAGFAVAGGWEKLGSDKGRGLQTPMATLHKFNGWADLFLTTPTNGLEDAYVSVSRKFDGVKFLPGLNATVVFHQFDSDVGNIEYGTEWDASLGFKISRVAILAKYADYGAKGFGVDTRKFWLQAEWAF
ncbi:alginate export family protein [Sphingomonas sp. G124]|uniref:Alginate export family protein n=1 Tax=Sphingomonas cremea TaxID=2904799 RepID=A0A9X1TXD3_9SPHN|nr:alginate export family protein [Sphingomonas cremea]MCF2513727.1 alginate export family protein [Sphingomonas cremea]